MVRFYVGRKQPGSTVLLSEAHHVVEAPPHMLPPAVKEGSMVDMEIVVDEEATATRDRVFQDLQKEIFEVAEADYFANTPPPISMYPDIIEVQPLRIYVSLSKNALNPKHVELLGIKYLLEVMDVEKPEHFPGVVDVKHVRMEEGSRNIAYLFDEIIAFIGSSSEKGPVLLYGLTDQIAGFAIAYFMKLTNFEKSLFGTSDSTYLAEYVMETLPGWDADLDEVLKALQDNNNDVAKAMDILCPSRPAE